MTSNSRVTRIGVGEVTNGNTSQRKNGGRADDEARLEAVTLALPDVQGDKNAAGRLKSDLDAARTTLLNTCRKRTMT